MRFFLTGIGTDVGKTVASAVVCKALGADYWKPVQSGERATGGDTARVRGLLGELAQGQQLHASRYALDLAASPHLSAAEEGLRIEVADFQLPDTVRPLVVEGAGGLLVPLNERETMLDLIKALHLPVLLVVRSYLGSINHTLLSVRALEQAGVHVKGLIYSGAPYRDNQEIIAAHTGLPTLSQLPEASEITAQWVAEQAARLCIDNFR